VAALPAAPDDRDPTALLAAAEARHRAALALLGARRATRDVGPAIIASFLEAAAERSLSVERRSEGLVLEPEVRHAGAIGDLARAFPHGAVVIRGRGARRFADVARRDLDAARFVVEESGDPLIVVFPDYVTH
ncbi:MAG: hypothetical protein KF901_30300, partial [Myxococcales bacterium]|nr:hypothetical protein [Myxococcales bacterium]